MKKSFTFYLAMGLISLMVVSVYCRVNSKSESKTKIIVDMLQGDGWLKMEGDSIWWRRPIFIVDSIDSSSGINMQIGHSIPQDTLFGLKNLKPVVIIAGDDTTRYFLGDTVRFSVCNESDNYSFKNKNQTIK
jgi:hypothetical protein